MTTDAKLKNIFGSVLTAVAPASIYRGETEANRTTLQKLRYPDGKEHTVVSAEAIRNQLRDMLRDNLPDSLNRERVKNEKELSVRYKAVPNPLKFADDMLFGFLALSEAEKQGDSMLRVNYAVSLEPYAYNKTMHQSPRATEDSAFRNATSSAIIEREVHVTAYQYPFGMNLNDLRFAGRSVKEGDADETTRRQWVAHLLRAIGELNGVAGNHARTMYSFAPVSIVLRLTSRRTPDFDLYGFCTNQQKSQQDLIAALEDKQLPANEFYIGGSIARENEKLRQLLDSLGSDESSQESPKATLRESNEVPEYGLDKVKLFKTASAALEKLIRDAGLDTTAKTSR